jgi:hypothetical protein
MFPYRSGWASVAVHEDEHVHEYEYVHEYEDKYGPDNRDGS